MHVYIDRINEFIKEIVTKKNKITVLEAGCGPSSKTFDFGENAHVTGVDISLNELHKNKVVHSRILGDIQTAIFKPSSFNVIVCIEVLEHVNRPELALQNFVHILKDGGIAVIIVPNVMSVKGLITKFTPYRFHYWVYKKIYKYKKVPDPTYLRTSISPRALIKFAEDNNIIVQWMYFEVAWLEILKEKSSIIYKIYLVLGIILKILTLGMISISKTDFIIVYRKV